MNDTENHLLFGDRYYEDVQLSKTPLLRVLCQIRWPQLTNGPAIAQDIADVIAKSCSRDYPLQENTKEVELILTPVGTQQSTGSDIFKFSSSDGHWDLSVSDQFLTLETDAYESSREFSERFKQVLETIGKLEVIPYISRIGYRYTNRIHNPEDLERLDTLVKPSLLGPQGIDHAESVELAQAATEAFYELNGDSLAVRWAYLGPNGRIDPTIKPVNVPSWVLDLDSYAEFEPRGLMIDPPTVVDNIKRLSDNAYQFFRAAVTDEFIDHYKGAS